MQAAFNQQNWKERKAYLGHTSENAFEMFCKREGILFEHFGEKNISVLDYKHIPVYVRTRPDYICQKEDESYFVEVKGTGRDGLLKIKLESVVSIPFWDTLLPVKIFVFDSARKRFSFFSFNLLKQKLLMRNPEKFDTDRKLYFPVSINEFTWGTI